MLFQIHLLLQYLALWRKRQEFGRDSAQYEKAERRCADERDGEGVQDIHGEGQPEAENSEDREKVEELNGQGIRERADHGVEGLPVQPSWHVLHRLSGCRLRLEGCDPMVRAPGSRPHLSAGQKGRTQRGLVPER